MPQMMPLNWLYLMIFFMMIFLLTIMINYYNFLNKPVYSKISFKKNNNWKW
uniref:ATP synthase complex subunit 8 n=1 Tax=Cucujoidea sp. 27 KM-2017 TaxID=2219364 RepID=A0A346RK69_9CUCU|nr:ATP synthase F0 subunit 8 [Cucujoidea sp. 27 KM-2017]